LSLISAFRMPQTPGIDSPIASINGWQSSNEPLELRLIEMLDTSKKHSDYKNSRTMV
jgi:hypothetical protein